MKGVMQHFLTEAYLVFVGPANSDDESTELDLDLESAEIDSVWSIEVSE